MSELSWRRAPPNPSRLPAGGPPPFIGGGGARGLALMRPCRNATAFLWRAQGPKHATAFNL